MMRLSAFFVKISTVKNLVGHPIFFTNHKRQESLEVRRNHVMVELSSLFDLSAHCVGFFFTWAFWSHFVAAKKWLCCYGDQKCQAYFVACGVDLGFDNRNWFGAGAIKSHEIFLVVNSESVIFQRPKIDRKVVRFPPWKHFSLWWAVRRQLSTYTYLSFIVQIRSTVDLS